MSIRCPSPALAPRVSWRARLHTIAVVAVFLVPATFGSVAVGQAPVTTAPSTPAVPAGAQSTITARTLEARLRFLTSDLLQGRVVGHAGNEVAEAYLASEFERLGLQGIGISKDGPYYQPFEMVGSTRAEGNGFDIRSGLPGRETVQNVAIGPDFSPMNFSAIGQAAGDLVFVGYGITAPEVGHDDYKGVDAQGKVVLLLDSAGKLGLADVPPAGKVRMAQAHGAVGVLAVPALRVVLDGSRTWPETVSPKVNRYVLPERTEDVRIPVANVSPQLAERLLGGGLPIEQVIKALDEKQPAASFKASPANLSLSVRLNRRRVTVRNVIAIMKGTDPRLQNQLVVVGGHFDANGIDDKGLIYTGADDNGSGAVGVVAVAEAFARAAESGLRPRRTVVFALWNAEEKGRGGSTYYVANPVPANGTVVVNVNLDHIGRNEENVDTSDRRFYGFPLMSSQQNANVLHLLGYSYCPDVAKVVMEENRAIGLDVRQDYDQHVSMLVQRSDQWSFLSKGIPAVFLHTGLHPDYHLPSDTIEKINFPKYEKIARLAFRVAWHLGNQAERPHPPTRAGDPASQ